MLGVSGFSSDMRVLEESSDLRAPNSPSTCLCTESAGTRFSRCCAGGLDAIVFTAGIGENSAAIRERGCCGSAWLGIEIDAAANAAGGPRISSAQSRVASLGDPD